MPEFVGFQRRVILDLWRVPLHAVVVFCPDSNFSFKTRRAYCALLVRDLYNELIIILLYITIFLYLLTLEYLIDKHVRLFNFQKKSVLCLLIRSCSFIYFWKKMHPMPLLNPVCLFFLEKIEPMCCEIINCEHLRDVLCHFLIVL